MGAIALVIVEWIILFIDAMVFGGGMMTGIETTDPMAAGQAMAMPSVPMLIVYVIFLYPWLALYAKRWHDRGKSGWWSLIVLVPILGAIWILVELGFLRGTEGPNQYGPDPLAGLA